MTRFFIFDSNTGTATSTRVSDKNQFSFLVQPLLRRDRVRICFSATTLVGCGGV